MAHEDDAPPYVAERTRCWSCMFREVAERNEAEANKGRLPPGTYFAIRPVHRNGHGG